MRTKKIKRLKAKPQKTSDRLKLGPIGAGIFEGEEAHPYFCMRFLDRKQELDPCSKEDLAALFKALARLCTISWKQINLSGRHQLGFEQIPVSQLKRSLPHVFSDDVDKVMVFRYSGKKAMAGHRRKNVFHLLFIDSDFSLYNHG